MVVEWVTRIGTRGIFSKADFCNWIVARRELKLAGFQRMQSDPGADGREERYRLDCVRQHTYAVATLTRPEAFGDVYATIRYFDSLTEEPLRHAEMTLSGPPIAVLAAGIRECRHVAEAAE
jgi:hypothetical protein